MTDKIYVGGGTAKTTQYGELLKISFNREDLAKMHANLNDKGYVNLNCNQRKEPSQYGQTHSLVIDHWQPDPNRQAQGANQTPNSYRGQAPAQSPAQAKASGYESIPNQATGPDIPDNYDDSIPF